MRNRKNSTILLRLKKMQFITGDGNQQPSIMTMNWTLERLRLCIIPQDQNVFGRRTACGWECVVEIFSFPCLSATKCKDSVDRDKATWNATNRTTFNSSWARSCRSFLVKPPKMLSCTLTDNGSLFLCRHHCCHCRHRSSLRLWSAAQTKRHFRW